jgi:hypothetical protein
MRQAISTNTAKRASVYFSTFGIFRTCKNDFLGSIEIDKRLGLRMCVMAGKTLKFVKFNIYSKCKEGITMDFLNEKTKLD